MAIKKVRLTALLLAIVAGALFLAYQAGFFGHSAANANAGAPAAGPGTGGPGQAIPVKAMRVLPGVLSDFISVNGATAATDEVLVSSETPGKIKAILFREGDVVKKGDILVRLDDDELQAQRNRLQVQSELNKKIAERLWGLYEKEGVSLQEYEIAAAEYEKSKAELSLLDAQLEKRVIRAPFNGRLGLRLVSEGSYLAPGAAIVKLVNLDPIKIDFSVPEKYSRQLGRGSQVEFQVDGIPGINRATVEAVDPSIDPATRTFRLKAGAPNPNGRILPGAFANVKAYLQRFDEAILVPTEAIVPELNGNKVFVYRNGAAEPTPVTTGIRQESRIQITEGLLPGDTVITTGILQIKPGAPVKITELE